MDSTTGKPDETAELLFQTIYYKNVELLKDLINANPGILTRSVMPNGHTPLHYAALQGAASCIPILCENYCDVDVVSGISDSLKTPLLLATESGHLDVIKELIKWGADLFYLDANGYSALQLAQIRNHGKIAEYLFERIDELRRESDQLRSELCKACAENNYAQVLDLLAKSSSNSRVRRDVLGPGKQDHEKSALFIASEHGHHEIVGALLTVTEHYAVDPSTGDTILHAAVRSQNPQTVQLILDAYGKQMDRPNNAKSLPLHLANELGDLRCAKILLFHKYPPSVTSFYEKNVNGLSYEFACNLNLVDGQCRTALHVAVEKMHIGIVDLMLKMRLQLYRNPRMDQSIKDVSELEPFEMGSPFLLDTYAADGRTPLMTSVFNRQQQIAEMLLNNGADINLPRAITDLEVANLAAEEARCVGSGALIEAARTNDLDLLKMLFFYGASDYDNQALKKAANSDNPRIISIFLDQLAFVDQTNKINIGSARDTQLSAMERLKSLDLLGSLKPNTACRLDWHNAFLRQLTLQFLVSATLRLNPRVRNQRMALTAITRIDLSDNQLHSLPPEIFQLQSLRTLNLDRNHLDELPLLAPFARSSAEQGCPYLEILSVEKNQLTSVADSLFDLRFFPQLRLVNLAYNKLRHLPSTVWRLPSLRELNVAHNEIGDIQAVPSKIRDGGRSRQSRNPYIDGARRAIERRQDMAERMQQGKDDREKMEGDRKRKASMPVMKVDVLRTNLWQSELNIAPLDDTEDLQLKEDRTSPIRKQNKIQDAQSNSIQILNLSGNRLQSVPDCLACYCPKVTKLDLSENQISSLRCVECLPAGLKHLNIAHNRLTGLFHRPDAASLYCYALQKDQMGDAGSTSVTRHSRSRSKSVARNQQRSLSIIRASKENENTELCSHKLHCRLEQLKTLNLAHNQLSALDLFIPFDMRDEQNATSSQMMDQNWQDKQLASYLIFPVLTNLDLSCNQLKVLPAQISLLNQLSVLNLNENKGLQQLPANLGLLEKLWSVQVAGCPLKEPLKSVVDGGNFKTMELISYLRNELDNSKPYTKLKLMILGRADVGKTSLLQQLRQEGQVPKGSLQSDDWGTRLGHPTKTASKSSGTSGKTQPKHAKLVDVAEWTYEPPRGSTKSSLSANKQDGGPITFRTWDFDKLHRDFQQVPQYFLTRRSIYLVVWKLTDGEISVNEIHEWLLAIHARAPNATVIIVGTHLDYVEENVQRFPDNYLENLERIIQQKFVNISDSEKKGLPKVVAVTFVSIKTRYNIQHLCQLIYYAAHQIKTPGRRSKLLQEKVPASFFKLEKIVVQLTDDFRARNEEPILKLDTLWNRVNTEYTLKAQASSNDKKMADDRFFRDRVEFRQACSFLHENGVLLMFEETSLRNYCFIDPPWLYTILRTILVQPHKSSSSLASMGVRGGTAIISTSDLFQQLKSNLAEQRIRFSLKQSQLKSCLMPLLSRCEMALPCFKRMLLVSPLLPDEYLLRADYPGARIKTRAKIWKFRTRILPLAQADMISSGSSSARLAIQHSRLQRQLGYRPNPTTITPSKSEVSGTLDTAADGSGEQEWNRKTNLSMEYRDTYRRLYLMQYIPIGFWPRLTTRILNDEKLCTTISELFIMEEGTNEEEEEPAMLSPRTSKLTGSCALFSELNDALNSTIVNDEKSIGGGFEFLLWQSGIECDLHSNFLFSLKQFLPLANVRDTNYSISSSLHRRTEDLVWRPLDTEDQFIVELLVPLIELQFTWKSQEYTLRTCPKQATRLLASLVGIIDDLLEDWFPVLGTRFIHSSDGQLLVDRLIPCTECAKRQIGEESVWRKKRKPSDPAPRTPVYLFSVEECILGIHQRPSQTSLDECPVHGKEELDTIAPDINFNDLQPEFIFESSQITRGKLIGRGAFGSVFSGAARSVWTDAYEEVALKVLETTADPRFGQQNVSATNTSDRLETIARSYCIARQELNLFGDLQHTNITVLLGFSRSPLTLLMELAPHGALNQLLNKYKRAEIKLSWPTIQQSCAQISRALEYLHLNHIIFRDLKSENVLVWRFPQPHERFSRLANSVHIKLGDYGISRFTYPNDVCKGYGGTEGFMAPEILRFNGEFEYTDKVDCYSFGMFIYELVSLHQPYDGQEQMKDCIFEGQRPFLSEKDILCPSNVLDLMVTCWAEQAAQRPSSSELVTICTAPEFTNLSDVALLTSGELGTVATVVQVEEDGQSNEHPLQCWLSRPDGLCTVLSFNEFGFVENEQLGPMKSKSITVLASVCGNIWSGSADGEITIYSPQTFSQLAAFSLDILNTGPQTKFSDQQAYIAASSRPKKSFSPTHLKTIRSIFVCAERRAVLITVPTAVLLLSIPPNGLLPQHISTLTTSDDYIHTSVVLKSANDWQIWTAHDDARIVTHHVAGSSGKLLYSASALHKGDQKGKRVKFVVPSKMEYGHAWSVLENDERVFMWQNGVIWRTLDCSKLLPVSESLSSMFQDDEDTNEPTKEASDSPRSTRISALNICANAYQEEQLMVGMSNGVIIVLECKTLSPLTSFRTYKSAVESILCTNTYQTTPQEKESDEEDNKKESQPNSKNKGGGSFFLTIGQKYRNLIKRLAPNVIDVPDPMTDSMVNGDGDKISYAIVWQGDNWK